MKEMRSRIHNKDEKILQSEYCSEGKKRKLEDKFKKKRRRAKRIKEIKEQL